MIGDAYELSLCCMARKLDRMCIYLVMHMEQRFLIYYAELLDGCQVTRNIVYIIWVQSEQRTYKHSHYANLIHPCSMPSKKINPLPFFYPRKTAPAETINHTAASCRRNLCGLPWLLRRLPSSHDLLSHFQSQILAD